MIFTLNPAQSQHLLYHRLVHLRLRMFRPRYRPFHTVTPVYKVSETENKKEKNRPAHKKDSRKQDRPGRPFFFRRVSGKAGKRPGFCPDPKTGERPPSRLFSLPAVLRTALSTVPLSIKPVKDEGGGRQQNRAGNRKYEHWGGRLRHAGADQSGERQRGKES